MNEKYLKMKKPGLAALAKERKIAGYAKMNKGHLVAALTEADATATAIPKGAVDARPASVRMKKHHSGDPIDTKGMKEYTVTGGITTSATMAPVAVRSADGWVNAGSICVNIGETVKMDPNGEHTKRFLALGVIR